MLTALPRVSPGHRHRAAHAREVHSGLAARLNQLCLAERGGVEHLIAMRARATRACLKRSRTSAWAPAACACSARWPSPSPPRPCAACWTRLHRRPGGRAVPGATAGLDEIEAGLAAPAVRALCAAQVAMATGLVKGRGAGALAPPDARPAVAGRLHCPDRGHAADGAAHAGDGRAIARLVARVAARHAAAQSVDQFVGRRPGGPGLRGPPDGTGAAAGRDAAAPGLGSDRDHDHERPGPGQPGAPRPQGLWLVHG